MIKSNFIITKDFPQGLLDLKGKEAFFYHPIFTVILPKRSESITKNYMHCILQATMQNLFIFITLTFFDITKGNRPQNCLLLSLFWCSYSF